MLKKELEARIISACENVIAAEPELTEIDSKFGDADHGLTMHKIAAAIKNSVTESAGDIKEMLDDAAMAVMGLNGGSAVPLWNSWLDGMQEGAPEADEVDVAGVKAMFASAFEADKNSFLFMGIMDREGGKSGQTGRRRRKRVRKTARTLFPSSAVRRPSEPRPSVRRMQVPHPWQSSLKVSRKNKQSTVSIQNKTIKGDRTV